MVRFVALAILLALAAGVYGFIQRGNVVAAQMQIDATNKELATWKERATQYQMTSKTATSEVDACNARVTEIQTALDAALAAQKKPAGRR